MNANFLVTAQPAGDDTFATALCISKQREAELDELMDKYHKETETYPDALAALSPHLQNANELAYASFHLGAYAEAQRNRYAALVKTVGIVH